MTHPVIADVTARIAERGAEQRSAYLDRLAAAAETGPASWPTRLRPTLAHGFAASGTQDKNALRGMVKAPTSRSCRRTNDMLSAHKPFESYPARLKQAVLEAGGIAQFAGPAFPPMCDGITQGREGMQLSLFSRDGHRDGDRDRACRTTCSTVRCCSGYATRSWPGMLFGRLGIRASPGHLRAGRSDDLGPAQTPRSRRSASSTPKARSARDGAARRRGPRPTTARGTCTFYGTANLQPAADGGDGAAPAPAPAWSTRTPRCETR